MAKQNSKGGVNKSKGADGPWSYNGDAYVKPRKMNPRNMDYGNSEFLNGHVTKSPKTSKAKKK